MPILTYLVGALLWGIARGRWAALDPVYVHLLVVGWITQTIFGVAYWMFPKHTRETPRGSDRLAIAC